MNVTDTNRAQLSGKVLAPLQYSHTAYDIDFFSGKLCCRRLSGKEDILPFLVPASMTELLHTGEVLLRGQIRSYNEYSPEGTHLRLKLFVRQCVGQSVGDCNTVLLEGHICKKPVYRETPFGRQITDLLLAVNRAHGKSDYIPVIVWGKNAQFARELQVGQKIRAEGRFQSRSYEKQLSDGASEQRTAYEISASTIYLIL